MRVSKNKPKFTDKKKLLLIVLFCVMCILALFCLIRVAKSFVRIRDFEVSGVTSYSTAELAGAANLKAGDKLYKFDEETAAEKICKSCPYVKTVNIKRSFFGKVTFEIEERAAVWYIEFSGDYHAIDNELYVIEESISDEKYKRGKITKLVLPNVSKLYQGELISFGKDENEIIKSCEIIVEINQSGMKDRLTYVNIENRFDIHMTVDGSYNVYMGDSKDLSAKLSAVRDILDSETAEGSIGGEIDASNPDTISFKAVYH